MTTNLHAHLDSYHLDCDGPLYSSRVETLTDAERAEHEKANGVNDFHDLHFKDRVLGMVVSWHPEDEATVTITKGGFYYSEQTDEGVRSTDVRWCEDTDCDPNARSQRDVFAEQMGY
jgi:hypothetical protein